VLGNRIIIRVLGKLRTVARRHPFHPVALAVLALVASALAVLALVASALVASALVHILVAQAQ